MNSEYCVICGEEIPEGRQVCPSCEFNEKGDKVDENMARKSFRARLRKFKALRDIAHNRERI